MSVLVLDAAMEILSVVDDKTGLNYLVKNKGNALLNTDRVASRSQNIMVPSIVMLNQVHAYKSRKNNTTIRWSKKGVLRRDNFTCAYCGGHGNTIDHIVPKDSGGRNEWLNTVAACTPCNSSKSNKPLSESGLKLLFQPSVPTYFKRYLTRSLTDQQKAFLIECGLDKLLN